MNRGEIAGRLGIADMQVDPLLDDVEAIVRDALSAHGEEQPVAYVTGYFAGKCTVMPINSAMVLPVNMALYSHPQPVPATDLPMAAPDAFIAWAERELSATESGARMLWGAMRRYFAAQPVAPVAAVPEGYVLVPIESTYETIIAICEAKNRTLHGLDSFMTDEELASIYSAMLAAQGMKS